MPTNLKPNSTNSKSKATNLEDKKANLEDLKKQASGNSDANVMPENGQPQSTGPENTEVSEEQKRLMEYVLKSEQEMQRLTVESEEWKNKYLKLAAEMENLQKHHEIANKETVKNTQKKVLKNILPFLNTLQLAFSYLPETSDPKIEKFFATLKFSFESLTKDLTQSGVTLIVPEIGSKVDLTSTSVLNPDAASGEYLLVKNVVSIGLQIDSFVIVPASVIV
jgi:molecular chaperone GrpE